MVRINKSKKSGGNNIGGVKKSGMKRRGPRKSVGVVVGDARYCKFTTWFDGLFFVMATFLFPF